MKLKAAEDISQLCQICEDIARSTRARRAQKLDQKIITQMIKCALNDYDHDHPLRNC